MTIKQDKTRIAFEAWQKSRLGEDTSILEVDGNGQYTNQITRYEYYAFQAATVAHAAETGALIEELKDSLRFIYYAVENHSEEHANEVALYVKQALQRVEAYRGKE